MRCMCSARPDLYRAEHHIMSDYRNQRSDNSARLPYSGLLLGHLARSLRLSGELDAAGRSDKTVQRYFTGSQSVDRETADAIIEGMVAACFPPNMALPEGLSGFGASAADLVTRALKYYSAKWDHYAGTANGMASDMDADCDMLLPLAPLRLMALDLGIRWGAWASLQEVDLSKVRERLVPWWEPAALGKVIDRLRESAPQAPTLDALARKAKVTTQTLHAWRSGKAAPSNYHIQRLARALTPIPEMQKRFEYEMRLVVACMNLRREVGIACGPDRVSDMLWALRRTAEFVSCTMTTNMQMQVGAAREQLRENTWKMVLLGAKTPLGAELCERIAQIAVWNQQIAADLQALPGNWVPRLRYWLQQLGDYARHKTEPPPDELTPNDAKLWRTGITFTYEHSLRMAHFDWQPSPEALGVLIEPPPEGRALNRALQADRARSVEDFLSAIEHARLAVKWQPQDPEYHNKLGVIIGEWATRGHGEHFEEALMECRLAVMMEPTYAVARNEIAIILSNAARPEEAEAAFVEAEPYYGHHAHHWYCRANNYLGLGRLEDAAVAYQNAIARSTQNDHLDATIHLAQVLAALGKHSEAQRWLATVRNRVHGDVLAEGPKFIAFWRRWSRRVPKKGG